VVDCNFTCHDNRDSAHNCRKHARDHLSELCGPGVIVLDGRQGGQPTVRPITPPASYEVDWDYWQRLVSTGSVTTSLSTFLVPGNCLERTRPPWSPVDVSPLWYLRTLLLITFAVGRSGTGHCPASPRTTNARAASDGPGSARGATRAPRSQQQP
jgi:hypothetical protein